MTQVLNLSTSLNHDSAMAAAFLFLVLAGFGWEALTPVFARLSRPRWAHPFGDIIDFVMFLVGGALFLAATALFYRT